jgi:predicted AAA+ superfamily ATPase
MKLIERKDYMDTLHKLKDIDLIKVVTGIRRSGKSTLLAMFRTELSKDVATSRIQTYNFEDPKDYAGKNWQDIYYEIDDKIVKGRKNYIFIDEVQNVAEFERLVDGLFINPDVDLYLTGSNAYLLSGELATLLTGRSFTIKVLPFSFAEFAETYVDFEDKASKFEDYMRYSSMPEAVKLMHVDPNLIVGYLQEIYTSILENDIIPRRQIVNDRSFENVVKFAINNIGNRVSPHSIANSLAAENKAVDSRTVDAYLSALVDTFLFYRVERFDIKGKRLLATQEKYYLSDLGFRNALLGLSIGSDAGRILENIIFLELKRRNSQIWIGKVRDYEIDFVVRDNNGVDSYYQVAYSVRDEATLERELRPFDAVNDHNLKFLVTMDPEEGIRNGVRQVNAVNFLLGESRI